MDISDLLKSKLSAIRKRWFDLIIESYPADSRDYFHKSKNRFQNPIGSAADRLVEATLQYLSGSGDEESALAALREFIRIRSVQEFSASQALAFLLPMKQAIREALVQDIRTYSLYSDLLQLESQIDRLLLVCFDIYMESREKLYQIRADEAKRRSFMAFKRLNMTSDEASDLNDSPKDTPQSDNLDNGGVN